MESPLVCSSINSRVLSILQAFSLSVSKFGFVQQVLWASIVKYHSVNLHFKIVGRVSRFHDSTSILFRFTEFDY